MKKFILLIFIFFIFFLQFTLSAEAASLWKIKFYSYNGDNYTSYCALGISISSFPDDQKWASDDVKLTVYLPEASPWFHARAGSVVYEGNCDQSDMDKDDIPDYIDPFPLDADVNNNGIPDGKEDKNKDNIPDWKQTDLDNNGIPDWADSTDNNKNGIPDWKEVDDNKDGIPDWKQGPGGIPPNEDEEEDDDEKDSDKDGVNDDEDPCPDDAQNSCDAAGCDKDKDKKLSTEEKAKCEKDDCKYSPPGLLDGFVSFLPDVPEGMRLPVILNQVAATGSLAGNAVIVLMSGLWQFLGILLLIKLYKLLPFT